METWREDYHAHRAQVNERSKRVAHRNGLSWSEEDDAVILDKLAREPAGFDRYLGVAAELQRTFESLHQRTSIVRKRHGLQIVEDRRTRTTAQREREQARPCPVDDDFTSNPEWYR